VFFIISEHLTFTKQGTAEPLKYDIPDHIKIITCPLTIIPEYFEWFPIRVTPMMGLPAGKSCVTVIVADVFNLLEV
jgi:hypothetical protein